MIYLKIFLEFLKVGCFSFGGAYFAIPLIRQIVLSNGWMTEEVFSYFVAVSESTPGPIMVNMATFVGSSQAGILGAALATLGVILPAFLIIIFIVKIMRKLVKNPAIRKVMDTILPCVVGVITATGAYMLLSTLVSFAPVSFDLRAIIIAVILGAILLIYKKKTGKAFSSILLIAISAVLGIVAYGI